MAREFKIGERLQIWDSAQHCYKQSVTVKQVIPEGGAGGGGVVVVYDKAILGVRPTQTFRPSALEDRVVA